MCDAGFVGVHLFKFDAQNDFRGSWARIFDAEAPCKLELPQFVQMSFSHSKSTGTFRGMHLMDERAMEWKLVSVSSGRIQDFLLDTRLGSPTRGSVFSVELSEASGYRSILIPPGVAHGFLTLENETTLLYAMTAKYNKEMDLGYSWKTPGIQQLIGSEPQIISDRDSQLPAYVFEEKPGVLSEKS